MRCGDGGQAGSLRGGWLPPLSGANARGTLWVGPIANRPQLAKLPHRATCRRMRRSETPMFTPEERARLRSDLLAYAASDQRISGAAITGSAAAAREDRWSDIDLAFGVGEPADLPNVLADWTDRKSTRLNSS